MTVSKLRRREQHQQRAASASQSYAPPKPPNAHGCRACNGQMSCCRPLAVRCPFLELYPGSPIPLRNSESLRRARAVPAVRLTAAGVCLEVSVSFPTSVTGSAFTMTSCACIRHTTQQVHCLPNSLHETVLLKYNQDGRQACS
jgi:hypothetical protein